MSWHLHHVRTTQYYNSEVLDRMVASLSGNVSILKPPITLGFKFHVPCRTGFFIFVLRNLLHLHHRTMHRARRHVNNYMSLYCTEASIKRVKVSVRVQDPFQWKLEKFCNFYCLKSFPIHSIHPAPKFHSVKGVKRNLNHFGGQNGVVGTMTKPQDGRSEVWIPVSKRVFPAFPKRPDQFFCSPSSPSSPFSVYHVLFLGLERPGCVWGGCIWLLNSTHCWG